MFIRAIKFTLCKSVFLQHNFRKEIHELFVGVQVDVIVAGNDSFLTVEETLSRHNRKKVKIELSKVDFLAVPGE